MRVEEEDEADAAALAASREALANGTETAIPFDEVKRTAGDSAL